MSSLSKVVYNIVSNPNTLIDLAQNPQILKDKFNLSHNEVVALKSIFSDHNSLHHLLSAETLKKAAQGLLEKAWIPPVLT